MTTVTKSPLHIRVALERTRQAEMLIRLRRATAVLLVPFTLALAISVHVFGDTTPMRTLGLIGMIGLTAVTHLLVQHAGAGRRAVSIAVVFVASLATMVLCTLAESGEAIHVQMGALSALTLGAAVLLPWGWVPQAVVSAIVGLGYLALPAVLEVDARELAEHVYALFDVLAWMMT